MARDCDHRDEEIESKRIPLLSQVQRGGRFSRELIQSRNVDDLERMSNIIDTYPSIASGDTRELRLRDSSVEVATMCLPGR